MKNKSQAISHYVNFYAIYCLIQRKILTNYNTLKIIIVHYITIHNNYNIIEFIIIYFNALYYNTINYISTKVSIE